MKRFLSSLIISLCVISAFAIRPFRFALLTDIHLSSTNPSPLEDLCRSIDEINVQKNVDFVVITGDITEAGDQATLELAKSQFDRLKIPYYVTSGNHETTWSESGCTAFAKVFKSDRFAFTFNDVFFIGMNTGPVLKMADGHVAPQDVTWAKTLLGRLAEGQPVICLTHYPLQNGDVDNWFDLTDVLRQYNTQCIIGGHYHRNLLFSADGIPDILCRSNLRGKSEINGYTLISVASDSIRFSEKIIGQTELPWLAIPFSQKKYALPDSSLRPDFSCNDTAKEKGVTEVWRTPLGLGVYSAAAVDQKHVYVGADDGVFYALSLQDGSIQWKYRTGSRIASSAWAGKGSVVFGSTDGNIYCLSNSDGEKRWSFNTGRAVQGCPVVAKIGKEDVVLVGGNKAFYAIGLYSGKLLWQYDIKGYCVSRPCVYDNKVYFGAWDCNFYCLNLSDGTLAWSWNNGRTNDKFSPASVWPVATDGKIFIVAPDRVLTCLNASSGEEIYRTNVHTVRENIGLSTDGTMVYAHCMWDSVVAMDTRTNEPLTKWAVNAGYGYDHDPSMVISFPTTKKEKEIILFGTKNGSVYALESDLSQSTGKVLWRYKVGNCVVNTITPQPMVHSLLFKKQQPINGGCIITSSDGNIVYLRFSVEAE